MGGMFGFCYNQLTFKPQPLPASISLEGKTALVTGANSGLGLEAARELASRNLSRLIIAVRDTEKGESAKQSILKESPNCEIEVWPLDHDSYDNISAFGIKVASLDRLDYALLNAGLKKLEYSTSPTGHEEHVQINHISTALISLLTLPTLERTASEFKVSSRMTVVSSEGHFWVPFKEHKAPNILARMDERSSFGKNMQRYYTTKLLNVLWVRELATRVNQELVIINAVNPGLCYSGLHRHMDSGIARVGINTFLVLFGWTSAQGGSCLTNALVEQGKSHGEYISEQQVKPPSPFILSSQGNSAQKKVWQETMDLLRVEGPSTDIRFLNEGK